MFFNNLLYCAWAHPKHRSCCICHRVQILHGGVVRPFCFAWALSQQRYFYLTRDYNTAWRAVFFAVLHKQGKYARSGLYYWYIHWYNAFCYVTLNLHLGNGSEQLMTKRSQNQWAWSFHLRPPIIHRARFIHAVHACRIQHSNDVVSNPYYSTRLRLLLLGPSTHALLVLYSAHNTSKRVLAILHTSTMVWVLNRLLLLLLLLCGFTVQR